MNSFIKLLQNATVLGFIVSLGCFCISGCGLKGQLYLPSDAEAQESSISNTEENSSETSDAVDEEKDDLNK